MKKKLNFFLFPLFLCLFFLGNHFFPPKVFAYIFSALDTSLDLGSPHHITQCEVPESGEVEYTWDPPSSYTSNQVKIETSSSIFDLKIDVCNDKSTCLVPITPGKRLTFKVKFSINPEAVENIPAGFRQTNCTSYIGVYRASSSSSTTLPTPTTVQKILPSPTPFPSPTKSVTKTRCLTDSDCKKLFCDACKTGKQICHQGNCVDCITDSLCKENFSCQDNVCKRKLPKETGITESPTANICGDTYCQPWMGEDCQNCPSDCSLPGFCCTPGGKFIFPQDFFNKIPNVKEAEAGLIPPGALVCAYYINNDNVLTQYTDRAVCDKGKIDVGSECLTNSHCPAGFCASYNAIKKCLAIKSEQWTVSGDRNEALKMREVQTNYKIAYIETYKKIKDQITSMQEVPGLEIKLEVQGETAGKISEVTRGKQTRVTMTIKNIADHDVAVYGKIIYQKQHDEVFTSVIDNGSTLSYSYFDDNGLPNIGVMFGSIKSAFLGYRRLVLLPKTEAIIYTNIAPQELGEIEVVGTVYYSSEKRFAKRKTTLSRNDILFGLDPFVTEEKDEVLKQDTFDQEFQKIILKQKVKVKPKKCGFFGC